VKDFLDFHIQCILDLPFIHPDRIAERDFTVVVDGVNSVGSVALPALLKQLGVRDERIITLNEEPHGRFAHDPEPLPENLVETIAAVKDRQADLGIVTDPDVDRLALIENGGRYVSEELTQVIAADFLWRFRKGPFVTNLSSSRAIDDVAHRYGATVYRTGVGEVNVVERMKEVGAVLGGEGNGGVILPDLHFGRDALVATAMILQHLVNEDCTLAAVRSRLPAYRIVKDRIALGRSDPDVVLGHLAERHRHERLSTEDGLKIDFDDAWVHMRKSNTEPIIRVYAEAGSAQAAKALAQRFVCEIRNVEAAEVG
jgi:phosphomannomutase